MKRTAKKFMSILLAVFMALQMTAGGGFAAYGEDINSEAAADEITGAETAGNETAGDENGSDEAAATENIADVATGGETAATENIADVTTGSETAAAVVSEDETAGAEAPAAENSENETAGAEAPAAEDSEDETAGVEAPAAVVSEDETAADEAATETEELTETEEKKPAFSESVIVSGVKIIVTAPEGVFPGDAHLFAESVPVYTQQMVDEAVEGERGSDVYVAVSYTFDIKVLGPDGNELQPASDQNVTVAFSMAEAADENLDAQIYHVSDSGNAEALDTSTSGRTVEAVSDGFSYYTVEFTYSRLTYVLPGGDEVPLSDILETVGLVGKADRAQSSNAELFSVSGASG